MSSRSIDIARKELSSFFTSPVAFLFLAAFLAVNLFIFFWVEKFFSRNIADVRPLFEWMPLLLTFLVAAITMRMWSEERRSGTIELLLTLPVRSSRLVWGKFLACMALVGLALLLTLPLPITVSFLGDLDWGPVFGGYVASLFLAGAYVAIGLFISARNDNQIVSLILTVLICVILYLVGSNAFIPFVGNSGVEFLQQIGTGSRFQSITRGVLDFRDIYYYASLIGAFLCLNIYALERLRSASSQHSARKRTWGRYTLLAVANLLVANIWLSQLRELRVDLTQDQSYTISDATRNYLYQLREPLLIRGYFSEKTHPLLAPLVPQIKDLIREYEIAGRGKVRVEFINPRENPDLEEEANRKYGIKPIPFQVSDKYEASLVNSYFDLLIQYGDQYEVLNFQDLIEVKAQGEGDAIDVVLRNPEYDITRSIKKVLYGFQSVGDLFETVQEPITFQGYISEDAKLPESLLNYEQQLKDVLNDLASDSHGKLEVSFQDPEADGGKIATDIQEKYGFRPMATSLFADQSFYFYTTLRQGETVVVVPLPDDFSKESARRVLDAALKRFSHGFLHTIGLLTPTSPARNPFMPSMGGQGRQFSLIQEKLSQNFQVEPVKLDDGTVPGQIDLVLVLSPEGLSAKQVFALDQFVMKGGTVVFSTSPIGVNRTQSSLDAAELSSGLEDWFKHNGIDIQKRLVLDPQNENYPVPVQRSLGGFSVQEIRMVPYPFFVDARSQELNKDVLITSGIPQVTANWASPLVFSQPKDEASKHSFTWLVKSSDNAWVSDSLDIIPNYQNYGQLGFPAGPAQVSTLAGIVEGDFTSFFAGKENPLLEKDEKPDPATAKENEKKQEPKEVISGIIERSSGAPRIIVFASNEIFADQTLQISMATGSSRYMNSLQLLENTLDWSLEDRGLLSIRSRSHFARTLLSKSRAEQVFWEYLNYGAALLGLGLLFMVFIGKRKANAERYKSILQGVHA